MRKKEAISYFIMFFLFIFGVVGIAIYTDTLVKVAIGIGGLGSSFFFLFTIIPNFPSYQKFMSPLLSTIGKYWERAELDSIAYKIQGNINAYRENVNQEVVNLIPEAKVEWVEDGSSNTFFDKYEGKVIIRLKNSKDNDINLVKATMLQVTNGVIPESRLYINKELNKSIDLMLVKKILTNQDEQKAYDYFVRDILTQELSKKNQLEYVQIIERIDKKGIFTRLYLNELKEIPVREKLGFDNLGSIRDDTHNLLNYVENIAQKEIGEDVPLRFEGKIIKTAVIMVAKPGVFEHKGIRPYVNRINELKEAGYKIFYIMGWENTIFYSQQVMNYLDKQKEFKKVTDSDRLYVVDGNRCICAYYKIEQ